MAAVARNGHGAQEETPLTATERAHEALLMGLRLREGVDLARIGRGWIDEGAVARLSGQGLVTLDGERLRVTEAGMLLLDAILPEVVRETELA